MGRCSRPNKATTQLRDIHSHSHSHTTLSSGEPILTDGELHPHRRRPTVDTTSPNRSAAADPLYSTPQIEPIGLPSLHLKNPAVKRILQEVKKMQSNPSDDFMSLPLEKSPLCDHSISINSMLICSNCIHAHQHSTDKEDEANQSSEDAAGAVTPGEGLTNPAVGDRIVEEHSTDKEDEANQSSEDAAGAVTPGEGLTNPAVGDRIVEEPHEASLNGNPRPEGVGVSRQVRAGPTSEQLLQRSGPRVQKPADDRLFTWAAVGLTIAIIVLLLKKFMKASGHGAVFMDGS
ncbi:uncharacterized protein LOC114260000 [Camellia sinensis]|uniref:uncharacterized protein LOC114260000 n=1 Tax=Camellia sinensis TaxID=4442 RepID=UPI00103677ED|nr:uncharacterized protein LOC114260000 [Camellia sinensis]